MRRFLAIAVWVALTGPGRAEPTADEIQAWIRDLDSSSFRTRDEATRKLRLAGADAAPPLGKAARTGGTEVSDRALRLLGDMAEGADPKAEAAARRQLRRIADGDSRAAADARTLLNRRRNRALAQFLFTGVAYDEVDSQIVRVDLDNSNNVPGMVPFLKEFPELETLSASTSRFTDAHLKYLADLPNLRDLNLYQSGLTDEGLKQIAGFKSVRRLPMGGTKVTDQGLKTIAGMTDLQYLGVRADNVTDAGLVHLKGLTNLTALNLGETKVTDAGLKHLTPLTRLRELYLFGTGITDAGLEHLKDFPELRELFLAKTKTTAAGRARLKEALPELRFPDID